MKFVEKTDLTPEEKLEILELWNKEYPRNLHYDKPTDFENYLQQLEDHFHIIVLDDNEQICGWYFDFIRADERWFAAIVSSDLQGKGIGTKLIKKAKTKRSVLNAWVIDSKAYFKINGQAYRSPASFYRKMDFVEDSSKRLETAKISAVKIYWKSKNSPSE